VEVIFILSRSETVCKLIQIRKNLHNKKECLKIKEQIDQLLLDIIGVNKKNRYKIIEILNKAICNEIKAKTAVVAIHETVVDNENLNNNHNKKHNNKTKTNYNELEELYQKGYR